MLRQKHIKMIKKTKRKGVLGGGVVKRRKLLRKGEGFELGLQWRVSFPLRKVRNQGSNGGGISGE